jgi:hypothetical protein
MNPRDCRSLLAGDVSSVESAKEGFPDKIACKQAPTWATPGMFR